MIALHSRLRRRRNILAQRVSDKLVLLNLESGEYYALDEVGGKVWDLCDGVRTVSESAAVIAAEYDALPETIETDVLELVGELLREKMVEGEG